MLYLIVNYITGVRQEVKLDRLIVACVFCPVLVVLGLFIAKEYQVSRRLIFRAVGANERLQTLCRKIFVFQDFLKLDLQLGGSMIIFILTIANDISVRDIVVLSVGGTVTVAWFILGFFAMKRGWKIGTYIFFIFSPMEPAYVIFKIYDAEHYKIDPGEVKDYGIVNSTIACGVVALVVRIAVIVTAIIVGRRFGNGLKDKLQSNNSSQVEGSVNSEIPHGNRCFI